MSERVRLLLGLCPGLGRLCAAGALNLLPALTLLQPPSGLLEMWVEGADGSKARGKHITTVKSGLPMWLARIVAGFRLLA